jgi:acetylglutamate kinase
VTEAPLVVKIGGTVAVDPACTTLLIRELAALPRPAVLVHGGGKLVTDVSARLGMVARFVDGVRVTTPAEMEVVDMVLAGRINTELVRHAQGAGVAAIGLNGADGGLLTGRLIADTGETRTARPSGTDPSVIRLVLDGGYLPIVATVGTGEDGQAVNINADDAAQAIAEALGGADLCYLSDIPGVLGADGAVIPRLDVDSVEELIRQGVARDGMAAKLRSAAEAIAAGVREVMIGPYRTSGDLAALLAGRAGTVVEGGVIPQGAGGSGSGKSLSGGSSDIGRGSDGPTGS